VDLPGKIRSQYLESFGRRHLQIQHPRCRPDGHSLPAGYELVNDVHPGGTVVLRSLRNLF
jgi:hypothetical protein